LALQVCPSEKLIGFDISQTSPHIIPSALHALPVFGPFEFFANNFLWRSKFLFKMICLSELSSLWPEPHC
jgi:hypothetical protein